MIISGITKLRKRTKGEIINLKDGSNHSPKVAGASKATMGGMDPQYFS